MDHYSSPPKESRVSRLDRLSQDMATLVNNRQGSDIQFKVGGGTFQNGDESATVILYAHSNILRCRSRYFSAMLDEDKNWKESSKGIIYKPNISPKSFQNILYYIYTGNVSAKTFEDFIDLFTAADEMGLEELSIECQTELIHAAELIFLGKDDSDYEKDENNDGEAFKATKQHITIDIIRTHVIPALNISISHPLSYLSQKLLAVILPHMSAIITSPAAYTEFVSGISSEILVKIIASDNLGLKECNVWDLVLSWACHQTNFSRIGVEARLKRINSSTENEEDEDGRTSLAGMDIDTEENIQAESDCSIVSITQLKQLKTVLAPFLPIIRFSLLEAEDYGRMVYIVNYFLSYRRSVELQEFFLVPDYKGILDLPRIGAIDIASSVIVTELTTWKLLRKNIFETGGITGCASLNHLKFGLLFRASNHGFLATTFHERCDNKGPTLVLIRSTNGYLFGGVNFVDWNSSGTYSNSSLNFLFSLPDGCHRKNAAIFPIKTDKRAACNRNWKGPTFGKGKDLKVVDSANTNTNSYSNLPYSYNGIGASNTALAGTKYFTVSDYEVFAIHF